MIPSIVALLVSGLAAATLFLGVVHAQPGTKPTAPSQAAMNTKLLVPGDPAPALELETWLKGSPIPALEKGTVYVIEFWSPTSAGSAANMPRLTEFQKRFDGAGVKVIGIVSKDPRSGLDAAKKAVTERADIIGYSISWDPDRAAFRAYMEASGSKFLPTTFIVNRDGVVALIQSGSNAELEKPLAEIVAGTYSIRRPQERGRGGGAIGDRPHSIRTIRAAANRGDWSGVIPAYEALPADDKPAGAGAVFDLLLLTKKDYRAASEFGTRAVEGPIAQDSDLLNRLAWTIVDPANEVAERDLDLALKAATRADELTRGLNAAIIDTVARVHFWKGDLAKAVELQKKSVAALGPGERPETREGIEATLKEYEQALKKK